mgnify:CR=1 FL=1
MTLTVHAENYRGLANVHWTIPPGLSVVIGANGAGKTTLLLLLGLLQQIAARDGGPLSAIDSNGGSRALKNFGAGRNRVVLGAEFDKIRWNLEIVPQSGGMAEFPAESLTILDSNIFNRTAGSPTFIWKGETVRTDNRSLLRQLSEADLRHQFQGVQLLDSLERCRIYHDYNLWRIRQGVDDSNHSWLHRNGINVFPVLRNWRDKMLTKKRYEFVIQSLRELFGFFGDLEFERGGNIISCSIQHRRFPTETFPVGGVANGWLVALLHLTAVAGAQKGDIIALDEFENTLHPRAINELLTMIHDYAEEQGCSVVITSQSAQVLDWFDAHPEQVFVLDARDQPAPRRLTDFRSEEWLAHFRLGRKFADGDFAAEAKE